MSFNMVMVSKPIANQNRWGAAAKARWKAGEAWEVLSEFKTPRKNYRTGFHETVNVYKAKHVASGYVAEHVDSRHFVTFDNMEDA